MRIQKYISQCGACSRREAERRILEGGVTVNGHPAQIGQDVDENADRVCLDGRVLKLPTNGTVTLAFNKPKGYFCTNSDPFDGGKTVFDLLPEPYAKIKLFCCGRLDKNSRGLLILTNDGELANRVTHPSYGIIKRYRVVLNRDFDVSAVQTLLRGVVCDGERLRAERVIPENKSGHGRGVEVWLNQGRKREIRRMFEAIGYFVKELTRFQIGSFEMKRIPEGSFRLMNEREISKLQKNPC